MAEMIDIFSDTKWQCFVMYSRRSIRARATNLGMCRYGFITFHKRVWFCKQSYVNKQRYEITNFTAFDLRQHVMHIMPLNVTSDICVNRKVILKWILKTWDVKLWIGFYWPMMGTRGDSCEHGNQQSYHSIQKVSFTHLTRVTSVARSNWYYKWIFYGSSISFQMDPFVLHVMKTEYLEN
jgi:hypothetical protein